MVHLLGILDWKKKKLRAGAGVQWLRTLVRQAQRPEFRSQHPYKKQGSYTCPLPQCSGGGGQQRHQPSTRFREGPYVKGTW